MKILEIKNLTFSYPDGEKNRIILDDISMKFESGKFYTILGESGSGKTTLLSCLAGLNNVVKGEVLFQNQLIQEIGLEKYRRNHLGIVFQNYNLISYMNAVENVMVLLSITDNVVSQDKRKKAFELLEYVGIDEKKAKRKIDHLSGGEQQRVAIARAIANGSHVLLADEPTGNLDENNSKKIVELFKKIAHEENKCVIMVTHSLAIANESDIIIQLNHNHQIEVNTNELV